MPTRWSQHPQRRGINGRTFAICGNDDNTMRIWHPYTGSLYGNGLTGPATAAEAIAITTINRPLVVLGHGAGTIWTWCPATAERYPETRHWQRSTQARTHAAIRSLQGCLLALLGYNAVQIALYGFLGATLAAEMGGVWWVWAGVVCLAIAVLGVLRAFRRSRCSRASCSPATRVRCSR